jgi:uncharacterized membrane protein
MRLLLAIPVVLALVAPARADLQFCNKTSYVLDLALGLEEKGAAATRGWFRVDPGQCKTVLQGTPEAEKVYVHARALSTYGPSPLPQTGHADFCIADGNFTIASAKTVTAARASGWCASPRSSRRKPNRASPPTSARKPTTIPPRRAVPGCSGSWSSQAMTPTPIDGLEGKKTATALDQFLKDRRLPADTANGATFFQVLLDAVKEADGFGFSWCNETPFVVMAAIGIDDRGAVTTRGWYRVDAGKCVKPELPAKPARLYSFAEAVDKEGQAVKRGDRLLTWGGPTQLAPATCASRLPSRRTAARRD